MARTVPTTEPSILVAGDSWSWTKTLSDYPPSEGWTLGYSFRGVSALTDSKVVVTTSGAGYSVSVAKADTRQLKAGAYQWNSYVDKAATGEHYTVESGVLTVLPSLADMAEGEGQTHSERMLAIVEAALEGRLTGDFESYSIGGRSITKIPMQELRKLHAVYEWRVRRANNPGTLGGNVLAQMNNPDGVIGTAAPVVLPPWFRALSS